MSLNRGMRSVPTIVFADGTILVRAIEQSSSRRNLILARWQVLTAVPGSKPMTPSCRRLLPRYRHSRQHTPIMQHGRCLQY